MSVVSVRLREEDERWLRARGLKPGTFARDAVHRAIRLEEAREAREWLERNQIREGVDTTGFIRKDRDTR